VNDRIRSRQSWALISTIKLQKALELAITDGNVELLVKEYNSFSANTEHDKRLPMDHAFRVLLMKRLEDDVQRIGELVRLSVDATRAEIVSNTIPVVLLIDTFDVVTLETFFRLQ